MAGRVLVYGGRGALGSQCVQYFKSRNWVRAGRERDGVRGGGGGGWAVGAACPGTGANCSLAAQWVASIDLAENEEASASVVVRAAESFTEQAEQVGARGRCRGCGLQWGPISSRRRNYNQSHYRSWRKRCCVSISLGCSGAMHGSCG